MFSILTIGDLSFESRSRVLMEKHHLFFMGLNPC